MLPRLEPDTHVLVSEVSLGMSLSLSSHRPRVLPAGMKPA